MKRTKEKILVSIEICPGSKNDFVDRVSLMRSLPDSFTENGVQSFAKDLETNHLILAKRGEVIIGFITWVELDAVRVELTWLAVKADMQAKGIGTMLVGAAHKQAMDAGAIEIEVKTLAEGPESPAYELTRRFYEKLGYKLVEVIDPYSGWEPGNPCAVYRMQF